MLSTTRSAAIHQLPRRLLAAAISVLSLGALGVACSESKPVVDSRDSEGLEMCCVLGAVCHEAEQAHESGGGGAAGGAAEGAPQSPQECHWLGHENDPDECRKYYEHCLEVCDLTDSQAEQAEEHACL